MKTKIDISHNPSFIDAFSSQPVEYTIKNEPSKIKKSANFLIFLAIFVFILLAVNIIFVCIIAFIPCSLQKCAENSICINHPFKAECRCKQGFNGNAKNYCDECGLTFQPQNFDNRIVGGKEANEHSWPMAVHIAITYKTIADLDGALVPIELKSFCGGTIIDAMTVMTAAHCIIKSFGYYYNDTKYVINVTSNNFHPKIESIFTVYVGAHKAIQNNNDISPAKPCSVSSVIVHEAYDDVNALYDIALLKLSQRLELNDKVQIGSFQINYFDLKEEKNLNMKACLPSEKEEGYPTITGISSVVIGWGLLEEAGQESDALQNVKLTIYDPEMCVNSTSGMKINWESQICAGDYSGGKDSCQGDSGSSLLIQDTVNGKKKFISIGVVSFGEGCAREYLPGVYTRVSYFMSWILKHL